MKTRPYNNPFTALIEAASRTTRLDELARAISYVLIDEANERTGNAPMVSRRIIASIAARTNIKLEMTEDRFWQATY